MYYNMVFHGSEGNRITAYRNSQKCPFLFIAAVVCSITMTSHKRHGVLNHRQLVCLFNSWCKHATRKTSKLCIPGPVVRGYHRSPVYSPSNRQWCVKRFHAMTSSYWNTMESLYKGQLKLQKIVHFRAPFLSNHVYFTPRGKAPLLKGHHLGWTL